MCCASWHGRVASGFILAESTHVQWSDCANGDIVNAYEPPYKAMAEKHAVYLSSKNVFPLRRIKQKHIDM